MDLDLGGLWSWTVPLWGLFAVVFFLGGVLTSPIKIASVGAMLEPLQINPAAGAAAMAGGARVKKHRA
jgi:hypothetical protein